MRTTFGSLAVGDTFKLVNRVSGKVLAQAVTMTKIAPLYAFGAMQTATSNRRGEARKDYWPVTDDCECET